MNQRTCSANYKDDTKIILWRFNVGETNLVDDCWTIFDHLNSCRKRLTFLANFTEHL